MTVARQLPRVARAEARAVRLTLGRSVSIAYDAAGPEFLALLRQRLSVPNPAHAVATKRRGTAFGIPTHLCAMEHRDGLVCVPRGCIGAVMDVARELGARVVFEDMRTQSGRTLECRPVEMRAHQRRALAAVLGRRQGGVLVLPAGGGKTRTALAIIAELRRPALVLVGAVDLAAQWAEQVREVLGVAPGLVGAGEASMGDVTIATAQTLVRWDRARLVEFLDRFDMLIVDECHHAASDTFAAVVSQFGGERLLGLTATPERVDGLGPMVEWYLGPELHRTTHAELIAEGHLVAPEVRELRTAFTYAYGGPDDWTALLDALWRDDGRDRLIVDATTSAVRAGHTAIVLTGRVEHAEGLAARLAAEGIAAAALTGKTPKRERTRILAAAREGALSVIVATSLADEGLDVPRLSCVVLAFPAKAAGRVEQRIGRIMRPHPDKRGALIIDVVDARVGVLAHQARKRRAVFERVLGGDA